MRTQVHVAEPSQPTWSSDGFFSWREMAEVSVVELLLVEALEQT